MSAAADARPSRPRRYDFAPPAGFANRDAGLAVAALDEASLRLFDMFEDLPQESLHFVPPEGTNSIAMLALHLAFGEAYWIARGTGTAVPDELAAALRPGGQDGSGELPNSRRTPAELIELCRRVRETFTKPLVAPLAEIDVERPSDKLPLTVRGVLYHQLWHWTYHSGQVGLLRRLSGPRMKWVFAQKLTGGPE
ncbi:MAG: DinB family protein [Planctomycetes bacterium]|nr:DinB family protein [Planctomycetota bacterium]